MSGYAIELGSAAERSFSKLAPGTRSRVRAALVAIADEAATSTGFRGKKVQSIRGTKDSFCRLRVGDYRAMFDLIDGDRVLLVLGIVHRGDLERWLRNR